MSDNLKDNSLAHMAKLDILRAIAIIIVYLFHAQNLLFPHYYINAFNDDHTMKLVTTKDVILNFSPLAFASDQTGTVAGKCSVSSTTVTITAASSNSDTWACTLSGNPN